MVQTATRPVRVAAGESRCGKLILEIRVRVPGGPLKRRGAPAAAVAAPPSAAVTPQRRLSPLEQRFRALCALSFEDRFEQAREAVVQVFVAKREHSLAAIGAGSDDAALAQHSEVVGEGRLGEPQVEGSAGALVAVGELPDDLESRRVAQCVEYGGELELLAGWMVWLSHDSGAAAPTLVDSSTSVDQ